MNQFSTLLEDLHASDASLRFSVLERLDAIDWTPERVTRLRQVFSGENDANTRFFMQKILARIEKTHQVEFGPERVEAVDALLKKRDRDYLTLALLLDSLTIADAPPVIQTLVESDWLDFPAFILPTILRFIRNFGSFENAKEVETLCRHPDPWVISAAIETLEKISPDSLKNLVIPLLDNPSQGIRSRAARLLYRWDPDEALKQFEFLLFSEDPEERSAALFNAIFLPFPRIESLLLQFLSVEEIPNLLHQAGVLFQSNPQPEAPLRLLELKASCRGEKRRLLGNILHGLLEALFQAGMIKRRPDEMALELEDIFQRRKTLQTIDLFQIALSSSDPTTRLNAARRLAAFADLSIAQTIREILQEQFDREDNPSVKSVIQAGLTHFPADVPPAYPGNQTKPESPGLPGISGLPGLSGPPEHPEHPEHPGLPGLPGLPARMDATAFRELAPHLSELLRSHEGRERVVLIKAIGRFGQKEDSSLLLEFLVSTDPLLVKESIEALQRLNLHALLPLLPKFLQAPDDDVRTAAIQALSLLDKPEAVRLAEHLVLSDQPRQRELGILQAGQFDFPAVQNLLFRALQVETNPDYLKQICAIFRPNLDEELFQQISRLAATRKGSVAAILESFLSETARDFSPTRPAPAAGPTPPETPASPGGPKPAIGEITETPEPGDYLTHLVRHIQARDFSTLPLAIQRRLLASVRSSGDFRQAAQPIQTLLGSDIPRSSRIALIGCIGNFGDKSDSHALASLLNHSDPTIVAAAITALGKTNLDLLQPYIGKLLANEDPRIKGATINVFLQFDKEGALQQVRSMVDSLKPNVRRRAVALLSQIDFPSACPLLFRLFAHETVPDLKLKAGYLLAANPSEDSLILLFSGTHDEENQVIPEWAEFWGFALDAAVTGIGADKVYLEALCIAGIARRAPSAPIASSPEKSLEGAAGPRRATVRRSSPTESRPSPENSFLTNTVTFFQSLEPEFYQFTGKVLLGGLIIFVLGWVLFIRPSATSPAANSSLPGGSVSGSVSFTGKSPVAVKGIILWAGPTPHGQGIMVVETKPPNARYYISVQSGGHRQFAKGGMFNGTVLPVARERETIKAKLISTE